MEKDSGNLDMRDEAYRDCLDHLSSLCANKADAANLDNILITLYEEHGSPILDVAQRYKDMCGRYSDLEHLLRIADEVFSVCGATNPDVIPFFMRLSKRITPKKLHSAVKVYFQKGHQCFHDLFLFIDSVGLSDDDFNVFADLALKTNILNCNKLVSLIKHYDPMDNVDHDFIKSCADILECGNGQEIINIARKFSALWQRNASDREFLFKVKKTLITLINDGSVADAEKFIENPVYT